mmetsp:Transcript_31595/g.80973  ORF Transcript_31595/g.80973 Transcript_31595/m.80973 type:complete len:227 (+) Transcript_31595:642-1322(+)
MVSSSPRAMSLTARRAMHSARPSSLSADLPLAGALYQVCVQFGTQEWLVIAPYCGNSPWWSCPLLGSSSACVFVITTRSSRFNSSLSMALTALHPLLVAICRTKAHPRTSSASSGVALQGQAFGSRSFSSPTRPSSSVRHTSSAAVRTPASPSSCPSSGRACTGALTAAISSSSRSPAHAASPARSPRPLPCTSATWSPATKKGRRSIPAAVLTNRSPPKLTAKVI